MPADLLRSLPVWSEGQASVFAIQQSFEMRGKMVSGWFFRYLDKQQIPKQSRPFSTREQAIAEACSYRERGYSITSLEGPGLRMTAVELAQWCVSHSN